MSIQVLVTLILRQLRGLAIIIIAPISAGPRRKSHFH